MIIKTKNANSDIITRKEIIEATKFFISKLLTPKQSEKLSILIDFKYISNCKGFCEWVDKPVRPKEFKITTFKTNAERVYGTYLWVCRSLGRRPLTLGSILFSQLDSYFRLNAFGIPVRRNILKYSAQSIIKPKTKVSSTHDDHDLGYTLFLIAEQIYGMCIYEQFLDNDISFLRI